MAVYTEARREHGRWELCLSEISDLLPADLELDFWTEGEEGEGVKKADTKRDY